MPTTEDLVLNQERKIKILQSLLKKSYLDRLMLEDQVSKMSQNLSENSNNLNNGHIMSTSISFKETIQETPKIQEEHKEETKTKNAESKKTPKNVQIEEDLIMIETLSEQSDNLEKCMRTVTREFEKYLARQKEVATIKKRYIENSPIIPNFIMIVSELHLLIKDGFPSVKQHLQDMFKLVNPDLLDAVNAHQKNLKKMTLRSNYLQIKVRNLEKMLESKEHECKELNALCENVTNKLCV